MKGDNLLNLKYWKRLILTQRWLVLACVLGVATLALVFSAMQNPVYVSKSTLFLSRQRVKMLSFEDIYTEQPGRLSDRLLTQIRIIESTPILESAVRDLEGRGLLSFADPGEPPKRSALRRLMDKVQGLNPTPLLTADDMRRAYVAALKPTVSVRPSGGNAFLTISVSHEKPQLAAELANAIADAYIRNVREMLRHSADEAMSWLSEKVREQKDKLMAAEATLKELGGEVTDESTQVGGLAVQEMGQLQQALLDVRLQILQAEAQSVMGGDPLVADGPLGTPTDGVEAELANAMREKVRKEFIETSVKLNQLRQRYGEKHPDVIQTAEREKQLRDELARLGPAVEPGAPDTEAATRADPSLLEALRAQEKMLNANLQRAMRSYRSHERTGMQRAMAEREVEINRALYNEMLSRLNEVTISAGLDPVPAELFESAKQARAPISPNHPRNLLLGLLAGFVLGLGGAAVRDQFDESVRDVEQANDLMRAPVLGMIPDYGRTRVGVRPSQRLIAVGPGNESIEAEAYRILRSRIEGSFSRQKETPVLLLTSAAAGEGKSTISANLAAAFAEAGSRVLLVDADFRRPSLARYLGLDASQGVYRVLRGELKPEQAARSIGVRNIDLLPCRAGGPLPQGASLVEALRSLFRWAGEHYDRIVVDTPVVMVGPGVAEIARAGSSILLVHRPGYVPALALDHVREHLSLLNASLVGVVLNAIRDRWLGGSYPLLPPYYYTGYKTRPPHGRRERDRVG